MNLGVYVSSSQSGRAYLADLSLNGHSVYGYCRNSKHGKNFVETIYRQGGLKLLRPKDNKNQEKAETFIAMDEQHVGTSLDRLILNSEVIILAEPSIYFEESARELKKAGICKKKIPLILSPARTFQIPKLWNILGEGYPIIGFSTCAYSCKSPSDGSSYIKRRKRSWIASVEGNVSMDVQEKLKKVFPQCMWTSIPAVTSLGNIGSVFHPATYLLNYEEIKLAAEQKREFSFYMEGIARRPEVGEVLEQIDSIRLEIAKQIGIKTLKPGCKEDELEWEYMLNNLHQSEKQNENSLAKLREIRSSHLSKIANMVVGSQFWLDYTYGVTRKINEPLYKTIERTPTYQKMSVAQGRYIEEDIPTGLTLLYEIGKRYAINVDIIEGLLYKYCTLMGLDFSDLSQLNEYSTEYITQYLTGNYNKYL